ncbi:MAG: S-layer homology domain-containing protein [Firmicutes bacterium]|nr:S-layer homology domain-containing protein [Bacillota bacterium]
MKLKSFLLSVFAAALFMIPTGICADSTEDYIVSVKDGAHISEAFLERYNLTPITSEDHGVYVTDAKNATKLENNKKIEAVEESSEVRPSAYFNDPYFSGKQQWIFNAINGYILSSAPINYIPTVVVIDTGFDFNHEDARNGRFYPGSDLTLGLNPASGRYPKITGDYFQHGTACAGVIGAVANNGIGVAGVFNRCNIYISSIFKPDENGDPKSSTDVVCAAIYDAVDTYGADVISMSLGDPNNTQAMQDAINYAYSKGVILVAASGNQGNKDNYLEYPACHDGVISVANASDAYSISNSSTHNKYVDVAAPGTGIYTLYAGSNSYASFSGTSLATPYVAALAAYAKSVRPNLSPATFEYYVRSTARDILSTGYDTKSGYGMIDCEAFSEAILSIPEGSGSQTDPYQIDNAEDLSYFISELNSGNTTACATINASFTVPSYFEGFNGTYNGTLDGDTHRISGLTTTLIDTLGSGGTINDLYVKGDTTDPALLVRENSGLLYACVTEGSVSNTTGAGFCVNNYGTIRYALNRAKVTGSAVAGIAVNNYGVIDQAINRGNISSDSVESGGICTYLQNGATLSNSYTASAQSGFKSLGAVVNTIIGKATVINCYFGDSTQRNNGPNLNIVPKTYDYMRTTGFLCMLNGNGGNFKEDVNNVNDGFPVWGNSDIGTKFYDVAPHEWFANDIYALAADEILKGRQEGYFFPNDNITRAEFLTILAKINGVNTNSYQGSEPFYDVNASQWYYNVVCWAYNSGLAMGNGDGSFDPESKVTREQIAAFIVRYLKTYSSKSLPAPSYLNFADNYKIASWAREDVSILYSIGIISGFPDNTFRPQDNATRAQAAKMTNAMRDEL